MKTYLTLLSFAWMTTMALAQNMPAPTATVTPDKNTIIQDYRKTNNQITATGWQYQISPGHVFSVTIDNPDWAKVNYALPPLQLHAEDVAKVADFSDVNLAKEFNQAWFSNWQWMTQQGDKEAQQRINMIVACGNLAKAPNATAQDQQNKVQAEKNLEELIAYAKDQKAAVNMLFKALADKFSTASK